jgi:hypothetical protein
LATAADLRRMALAFPGVAEYPHFDRRAFKARVTFATLAADEESANLKLAPDEQEFKRLLAPEAFQPVAGGWGRMGWTRVELSALNEPELRTALELAFARAGPKPKRPRKA